MTYKQPGPDIRRRLEALLSAQIDGELSHAEVEELEFLLRDDPVNRQRYLQYMDLQAALPAAVSSVFGDSVPSDSVPSDSVPSDSVPSDSVPSDSVPSEEARSSEQTSDWISALVEYSEMQSESSKAIDRSFGSSRASWMITFASLAATCLFAIAFYTTSRTAVMTVESPASQENIEVISSLKADQRPGLQDGMIRQGEVILTQSAGAELFGEFLPPVGEDLEFDHEYALTEGMIGLRFPDGAEVILEAPSIVEITGRDRLMVSVGRCSVHAPPGAEGFEVVTPQTNIIDRGTRFSVSVSDVGATDVQVIEGLAEVRATKSRTTSFVQLAEQQARRFSDDVETGSQDLEFDARSYRKTLPDRVVSYRAKSTGDGSIAELQSVTVQRGNRVVTFPVSHLIGVKVTHFRGSSISAATVQVGYDQDRLAGLEADSLLYTGVLNPGGSVERLADDPVLEGPGVSSQTTPGLAIQFLKAVVNRPGPDVVFFEVQSVVNPSEGDAFHVSPLKFREGLRSFSIRKYDITMTSHEAQPLIQFEPYFFRESPSSLEELMTGAVDQHLPSMRFRALAVGIDLSDMGYADGATVDGLFFQDALDDDSVVDPVFIAGLPSDESEATQP